MFFHLNQLIPFLSACIMQQSPPASDQTLDSAFKQLDESKSLPTRRSQPAQGCQVTAGLSVCVCVCVCVCVRERDCVKVRMVFRSVRKVNLLKTLSRLWRANESVFVFQYHFSFPLTAGFCSSSETVFEKLILFLFLVWHS